MKELVELLTVEIDTISESVTTCPECGFDSLEEVVAALTFGGSTVPEEIVTAIGCSRPACSAHSR